MDDYKKLSDTEYLNMHTGRVFVREPVPGTMNEQYSHMEVIRGRLYRYDPDFDAYYRVQEVEGPVSKSAWVVLVIVLAIACFCIEYRPGLV